LKGNSQGKGKFLLRKCTAPTGRKKKALRPRTTILSGEQKPRRLRCGDDSEKMVLFNLCGGALPAGKNRASAGKCPKEGGGFGEKKDLKKNEEYKRTLRAWARREGVGLLRESPHLRPFGGKVGIKSF